jgi:hypothetical protein
MQTGALEQRARFDKQVTGGFGTGFGSRHHIILGALLIRLRSRKSLATFRGPGFS